MRWLFWLFCIDRRFECDRAPIGALSEGLIGTAFAVTSEAIQIHGGNGLTREYPVEKMLRDARASMIEDGVNETMMLGAFDWLK